MDPEQGTYWVAVAFKSQTTSRALPNFSFCNCILQNSSEHRAHTHNSSIWGPFHYRLFLRDILDVAHYKVSIFCRYSTPPQQQLDSSIPIFDQNTAHEHTYVHQLWVPRESHHQVKVLAAKMDWNGTAAFERAWSHRSGERGWLLSNSLFPSVSPEMKIVMSRIYTLGDTTLDGFCFLPKSSKAIKRPISARTAV